MIAEPLSLSGLKLITLQVHRDERGYFVERYNKNTFRSLGLPTDFFQDNFSTSLPGVIRGLHYQSQPNLGQGKLVSVTRGKILDVAVDLRTQSPTYQKFITVELSDKKPQLLWIPAGFAHGFCVMGDQPADVLYKVDTPYHAASENGIIWNDRQLNIPWPVKNPIVSKKDQNLPTLEQYTKQPVFERAQ